MLSEYFVTVTRKLAHPMSADEAWEDVLALLCWNPQPVDRDVMIGAREIARRHGLSWWDSLVVSAAQAQGRVALLSEDLHDGADFGGVSVRSPFSHSVSEPRARRARTVRARRLIDGRLTLASRVRNGAHRHRSRVNREGDRAWGVGRRAGIGSTMGYAGGIGKYE